jgi:hypothetical protein
MIQARRFSILIRDVQTIFRIVPRQTRSGRFRFIAQGASSPCRVRQDEDCLKRTRQTHTAIIDEHLVRAESLFCIGDCGSNGLIDRDIERQRDGPR